MTQEEFLEAVEGTIERIGELAREAFTAASAKIDKIFLTGGASRSPAVVKRIVQSLGIDVPIVRGDDLGSVGMGLTQYAHSHFG